MPPVRRGLNDRVQLTALAAANVIYDLLGMFATRPSR